MSVLVTSEIIGLFFILCNSENLRQPNQMQLSKKQKTFSEYSPPFLKSTSIF